MITEEKPKYPPLSPEYLQNGSWKLLFEGENKDRVKIHRFARSWGGKIRISIEASDGAPSIAELGVYDERR